MVHKSIPILLLFALFSSPLQARFPTTVTADAERDYFELLFLYERTKGPGEIERIYRPILPFYGSYRNQERGYTRKTSLYPVFLLHGTHYWRRWSVLNLFSGSSFYHVDTKKESDIGLAPLFFWGRGDTKEERYFTFFPLFGKYKDKLGWSEINFFLFPLYTSWFYKDYRAHSILWPFIMWGKGNRQKDFRFLPFYSSKKRKGEYIRRSVLWPFFQWGHLGIGQKEPRHYFMFWPLYGHKWSEHKTLSSHSFLWPLFGWGHDKSRGAFDLKLFMLYLYGHSKKPAVKYNILFPIAGYHRFGSEDGKYYRDLSFFLLAGRLRTESSLLTSNYKFLIPVYWNLYRHYKKEDEWEKYYKIWPLFVYTKDSLGNRRFQSLALWPLASDEIDRLWGPIWTLYEYRKYQNGDRYHSVLFRTFSMYRGEEKRHYFALGFDFFKSKTELSFQFLGGLFGFHRKKFVEQNQTTFEGVPVDGKEKKETKPENHLRLLWITF